MARTPLRVLEDDVREEARKSTAKRLVSIYWAAPAATLALSAYCTSLVAPGSIPIAVLAAVLAAAFGLFLGFGLTWTFWVVAKDEEIDEARAALDERPTRAERDAEMEVLRAAKARRKRRRDARERERERAEERERMFESIGRMGYVRKGLMLSAIANGSVAAGPNTIAQAMTLHREGYLNMAGLDGNLVNVFTPHSWMEGMANDHGKWEKRFKGWVSEFEDGEDG